MQLSVVTKLGLREIYRNRAISQARDESGLFGLTRRLRGRTSGMRPVLPPILYFAARLAFPLGTSIIVVARNFFSLYSFLR
jgi:hypothetical protein